MTVVRLVSAAPDPSPPASSPHIPVESRHPAALPAASGAVASRSAPPSAPPDIVPHDGLAGPSPVQAAAPLPSDRAETGDPARLDQYLAIIRAAVEDRKDYPMAAKRLGLQGSTVIRVHINPQGKVTGIAVALSSGHTILDKAAQDAVRAALPFRPPAEFGLGKVVADIPIAYKLN